MNPTALPRLEALTGLRYLAAMSVLLGHMSHNFPKELGGKWMPQLSGLGMPLFFTLSGFLMAYNYSAGFQNRFGRTLRSYYVARFARIYPVYILCLLLSFSFMGCFFNDVKERPGDVSTCLLYLGTATQSWVHVPVFTDHHMPRTVCQSYLGVAWSVSTEAFFYLVFPLVAIPLARLVTGRGRMVLGTLAVFASYLVAGYLIYRTVPPARFDYADFGMSRTWWKFYLCPYMRFGEFLIGAIAGQYFLLRANEPAPSGWRWWLGAAVLAGASVLMVVTLYRILTPNMFHARPFPKWVFLASMNVLLAPCCAAIIYQLAALPSLARRALGCHPMVVLGEMSYCMYLLHPLVQSFYHPRSAGEGPLTAAYVVVYNNLGLIVVLHLICLGMYKYWELPARTLIRNLLDPKPKTALSIMPAPEPVRHAA